MTARPPDPSAGEGDARPATESSEQAADNLSQDSIVEETQLSSQDSDEGTCEPEPEENEAQESARIKSNAQRIEQETTPAQQQTSSTPDAAEQQEQKAERDDHAREEAPGDSAAVEPFEMFEAVVVEMKGAPQGQPREAWTTTIGELYSIVHAKVKVDEDLIPNSKRRYPKLKGEEKILLYKLFREICVIADGSFEEWERYAQAATQDLYNTSWSFKTIMNSMISKVKWAKAKPLNQWAAKVKAGTRSGNGENEQADEIRGYQDFMFNPANFTKQDITELRAICELPAVARAGRQLRQGTTEEWKIIGGIAEGSIVCRRTPEFLKSVLDSKERIRLYRTVQRQVEGELKLQLRGRTTIKPSRQHTQAIQEDIRIAAEELHVNTPELRQMLTLAKTISYNHVQRSLHFFFFDRATARQFQTVQVPFKMQVYRLGNVHRQTSGSVWSRQLGRDGTRPTSQLQYEIDIHNVTRFTDIGRLVAYLQQHITVTFEMEDLDTCTPESRTSTVWRLTAQTAECPDFLRGIVRIVWFGRTLVLKHPSVRHRLQCLRCGNLGHTMIRCRYTDTQLLGNGSRIAQEHDVAKLDDLAKPFASLEEVKLLAAKRLAIQEEEERKAQVALSPTRASEQKQQGPTPTGKSTPTSPAEQTSGAARGEERVEPAPKRPWATIPMRNGRTLYAHPATLHQKIRVAGSRYAELADDDDEEEFPSQEEKPEKRQEVIEIPSDDELEEKAPVPITPAAKAQLHLVQAKPPQLHSTPELVGLKQRERKALSKAIELLEDESGSLLPPADYTGKKLKEFADIEDSLSLCQVSTPASGNCMTMALAQALADNDLAAHDEKLEEITACLKRGIKWAGQLHLPEQVGHFVRMTTLINVQRGWDGMEAQESLKQFKWYLEEFASTPSHREAIVMRYNWGCSEMMALAANFLQRQIFVLAYDTDHKGLWYCSMYKPSTTTRGRQTFEIGQHVPLQLGRCVALIRAAKTGKGQPPLVIRYWGEHYSAFIHKRGPPSRDQRQPGKSPPTRQQGDERSGNSAVVTESSPITKTSSQAQEDGTAGWTTRQWDGDVEELRGRLMGMSLPHDLQCEIYLILEHEDPSRYAELLAFLVNTASQLSLPERERLLRMDLTDETEAEVTAMLQKYQLPLATLQQWQEETEQAQQEEVQLQDSQRSLRGEDSDSSYHPASAASSQNSQVDNAKAIQLHKNSTKVSKRQHTLTPIEGEQIRMKMKSKLQHPSVVDSPEPMRDDPMQEAQGQPIYSHNDWWKLWSQLGSVWPTTATAALPLRSSTVEQWCATAQHEPVTLIRMCKLFQYPEEVLASLDDKVLEVWTAGWRKDCLYGSLLAYRSRAEDLPTRRWLDKWKAKLLRPAPQNLAPLIDDSEDWTRLHTRGYGGDEVLNLCDVRNKGRLAHNLLCALIYEREIRVLTGREDEADNGPLSALKRHLDAQEMHEAYRTAYPASRDTVDWRAVARFFSDAVERGEEGWGRQY